MNSDETAAGVDEEVIAILKESYDKAKELLSANRELMDKIAEYLIEKETITGKEFMEIFYEAKPELKKEKEEKDKKKAEEEKAAKEKESVEEKESEEVNDSKEGNETKENL